MRTTQEDPGPPSAKKEPSLKGFIQSRRWTILLCLLTLSYAFDSISAQSVISESISRLLYVMVFAGAFVASDLPDRVKKGMVTVVLFWPLVSIVNIHFQNTVTEIAEVVTFVSILGGALVTLFRELMKDLDVDAVAGSIFGYFLITLAFALFYVKLEAARPGSFDLGNSEEHVSSLVYFSLVTITTLGFGDITPISRLARVVVGIEAATGLMYVAVFIGRVIGRR